MTRTAFAALLLLAQLVAQAVAQAQDVKGVWEPVNYSADIRFTDVFFVTPETGYVGGVGSTILKTTDSGATWNAQLGGDPDPSRPEVRKLHFLDERTGWAALYNSKLLRTTDGESWEEVGELVTHFTDFAFTSVSTGVTAYGSDFYSTRDGGQKWRITSHCQATAEVEGLNRQLECNIVKFHFVSAAVGYALGSAYGVYAAVFMRTEDGGETWSPVSTIQGPDPRTGGLFFLDENNGFFVSPYPKKTYRTTDGARTWTVVPATEIGPRVKFADPEVGWSFQSLCVGMGCENAKLFYTTDGGRRWSSKSFPFPTGVTAFSLPRRDVGYAVGDHGMIYRYRLLPTSAAASPKAIAAMPVPPLDNGVVGQIEQLDARLDTIDASSWDATDATQIEQLAPSVETIVDAAPALGRKHRNVNLVLVGLKLLGDLTGQGGGLREAFASLRQAKDSAGASAALADVHTQLDAMKTSVESFHSSRRTP
jgi:photosystem II stability/assembly factor-like uncharacterized protein